MNLQYSYLKTTMTDEWAILNSIHVQVSSKFCNKLLLLLENALKLNFEAL